MKTHTKLILVLGLAAVVVLAVATVGVSAISDSDDDIPGVELPESPITGALDTSALANDWDDVYAVPLGVNERLSVSMTGMGDFDMWLLKPGTPEVENSNQLKYVVAASQTAGTSSETIAYPAIRAGTYYLDVFANDSLSPNTGEYVLTWSIDKVPTPSVFTTAPSTVAWRASGLIEGRAVVAGQPVANAPLLWQSRTAGTTTWKSLNLGVDRSPTQRSGDDGSFSKQVAPAVATEYRFIVWPTDATGWRYGPVLKVTPRVALGAPKVSTATKYRKKPFKVWGYVTPRHRAGIRMVRLTARKGSTVVTKSTLNYNYVSKSGVRMTKYAAYLTLPSKGTWTITASTASDGAHAATKSRPMTVVVR